MLLVDMYLKNFIWCRKYISCLILIHFLCLVKLQTPTKNIVVLLSDEVDNTNNISFHLSRPKDIIAGACLAAHFISNFQDSLLCHFQINPLLVSLSDPVKGVPKLLEILQDPAVEVIGVTGVVTYRMEEFYSPLITHFNEKIPQKYLNSYLPSLEDTANTVIKILQQLNWTKVTIIQTNDYKYEKVANYIKTAANTTLTSFAVNEYTIVPTIQKLKYGETKIFLILAPPHISYSIIHKAIEEGVVWPHYVLVVVLLEPASLTLSPMWENVLMIMYKYSTLDYSNTSCAENVSSTSNFYSSLLYDAVWQVLMANESRFNCSIEVSAKSSHISHRSISDCIQSDEKRLNRTQLLLVLCIVRNQGLLELGYYRVTDSSTQLVNVVDLPTDQLSLHLYKYSRLLLVMLCTITFITYVLAFANFSIMIAFRNEKEVKASSFVLTIVIFIGCCFLLFSATLAVLSLILRNKNISWSPIICIAEIFSFNAGMAILLLMYILRTLRIWRIFSHFGKMSAAWSDSRLLVVVLIGSAVILILSIVFSYDYEFNLTCSFRNDTAPPYYEYTTGCVGNTSSLSQGLKLFIFGIIGVCYVILLLVLSVVSSKTSNIKRRGFKQIKRTIILIIVIATSYCLLLIAYFSAELRLFIKLYTLIFVASSFLVQLIIFPPIFYPIVYRRIVKLYYCFFPKILV